MKILILGGNRFFGRHLAELLLADGHELTLLNRGQVEDGLGSRVERLRADRKSKESLAQAVRGRKWDLVYDQICYSAGEAREACEIFETKTDRYVVTSSESVYEEGALQSESEFDPRSYRFSEDASPTEDYQSAKRQVEAVFSRSRFKEVVLVRPSLVVGRDDYTGRLKWHVERVMKGLPIFFPNIDIESDFIRSDQAGAVLKTVGLSGHVGPVNCAAPGAIRMRDLVDLCEEATGGKAILVSEESEDNHSPYGGTATKTMRTDLLLKMGLQLEPSPKWMTALIRETARGLRS